MHSYWCGIFAPILELREQYFCLMGHFQCIDGLITCQVSEMTCQSQVLQNIYLGLRD